MGQRPIAAAADGDSLARPLDGQHVLIVEDDRFALGRMAAVLRRICGAQAMIVAAGGFDCALDACRARGGGFGLALLGYRLWPGDATGIDLLAALRAAGLPATARTVLCSITMDAALRQRALTAGFSDTLSTEDIDAAGLRTLLARLQA